MSNEILIGILMGLAVIGVAAGAMAAYFGLGTTARRAPATTRQAPLAFGTMARWYAGRQCAVCGREIPPLSHFGPQPGLKSRSLTATTVAWTDIASTQLPQILETHEPVCSSCHLMTWFQHEHSDLLIDRHRTQDAAVHRAAAE